MATDDVTFDVHVRPGARQPGVGGEHDGSLVVRVAAAPEKGKANQEVAGALADALGVARREVEIVRGAASRRKTVRVSGDRATILARLTILRSR